MASVNVLRDIYTGSAKGFGFVKFHRAYHAALAFENCDRCKHFSYHYAIY